MCASGTYCLRSREFTCRDVLCSLERLRIGVMMAGGGAKGVQAMADAMRAMAVARVFGPPSSPARDEWNGELATCIRYVECESYGTCIRFMEC